jgi:hypothetical protein
LSNGLSIMSRRSLLLAVGIAAGVVAGVVGLLALMVRYEPGWYAGAGVPPGPERTQLSRDFMEAFSDLKARMENEPKWGGKFTARQVNAYFEEGIFEQKLDADLLRGQISEPRVAFEENRVHLGFRYGKGLWSAIISVALRVWVPQEDTSAVVVELDSIRAGALPVAAQSVLEEVSRLLREKDIEINWYRHEGHPCAVLRFQTDPQRSPIQLTAIQSKAENDGVLTIQGRTNDIAPTQPSPTPGERPPGPP